MADAKRIIFYSWQSDLFNKTNRGFIEEALEKAVKAIHKDDSIEIKPVIDRDTEGIAGSPDISKTIFSKIIQSDIFLCDVSIVGTIITENGVPRPMPNPNVLVELGYALAKLGDNRIIMVVNDAFGKPELLPFDLRPRKVISYHMPKTHEPATARKVLESKLTYALTTILKELDALPQEEETQTLTEQAKNAVETARPNQGGLVKQYMTELANKIAEMNPKYDYLEEGRCYDQLLDAINTSTELVTEFARLASSIAMMPTDDAVKSMYKGFENILNLYSFSPEGPRRGFEPDLARFLGHELFVIFLSCLLHYNRWELITEILNEELYAKEVTSERFIMMPFHHLSVTLRLFYSLTDLPGIKQISTHADLLRERHTKGDLAKLVPIEQFMECDYFLFLRAQLQPIKPEDLPVWMPWSSLHMHQVPRYLQEARRIKYAQRLRQALGVEDIKTLQTRLIERKGSLEKGWGISPFRFWYDILENFDINTIGTE